MPNYLKFLFAFYIVAILSSFSYMYFSWSGLASNQTVSWNNANDAVTNGYFSSRSSTPTGLKQITKSELLTNYWVSPYNATLYEKANTQLVTKQDVTSADVLSSSAPLYYSSAAGHTVYGWSNPCSVGTTYSVTAYYQPSIVVNSKLYADVYYTQLFSDPPQTTDWFSLNGTPVKLDTYNNYPDRYRYITSIGSCESLANLTQSTPYNLRISGFSSPASCSDVINLTGEYIEHSDGLTYTWNISYNIISGNTTHPNQIPYSDLTGLPLVSGDQITKIYGGSSITAYICSGTTYVILSNPLP